MARDTSSSTTSRVFAPYQPPRTTGVAAELFADPQPARKTKKDCGYIDFNDLSSIRAACKRHCSSATKKLHLRLAEMSLAYSELTALLEDMKRQKAAVVEEVELLRDMVDSSRRQPEVEPEAKPSLDDLEHDIFGDSDDEAEYEPADVSICVDDAAASVVSDYSSEAEVMESSPVEEAPAPKAPSTNSFGFFQAYTPSPLPVPVFQPGSQGYATPSDAIHSEISRPALPKTHYDPARDPRRPEYNKEAAARGYSYKDNKSHGHNPYNFGTSQAEKSRRPQSGRDIIRAAQKNTAQQNEDPAVQQVVSSLESMYLKPKSNRDGRQSRLPHWSRPVGWPIQ